LPEEKMLGKLIGYEFLKDLLGTSAFPLERPARVASVTKVTIMSDSLAVPASVAPTSDAPLEHLHFALKHEGLQLQAAILALKQIDPKDIGQAFENSPSSAYLRQICYLWELANGVCLEGLPAATGPYTLLFDPAKFVTGPTNRHARWRVDFNGLGSTGFCPTVRRTPEIQTLLGKNILSSASEFMAGLDKSVLDRAVRWAYLSETQGSYAIENESPTSSKAEAFAALLSRAHAPQRITEEYLVALQNLAVANPLDQAVQFRTGQNWLRNALPGALGVTYLPPPPDLMMALIDQIMGLANRTASGIDPLVLGSLVSFGFVFAHPFMDGNGRLSRFLFHKVVCGQGQLPNGLVLPVSVAMKRHEERYLQVLQTFSRPARALWQVTAIDDSRVDAVFKGDPAIYQYWDATDCVAFGLQMASDALDHDLRDESEFLRRFDVVYKAVNDAVDMNNNDLVLLVRACLQNAGTLSNNRHKQLVAKGHPAAVLDRAQQVVTAALEDLGTL
jgi:hypothetical protein